MNTLANDPKSVGLVSPSKALDTRANHAVAWVSLAVGAYTGLILGMWSFDGPIPVPSWIGDYTDLPRRLLRLGHIAFFGLAILNILLARHLTDSVIDLAFKRVALRAMNFGNIALPLTLIAAAMWEPAKYVMSVPAFAVTLALTIGAYAAYRDFDR